jgi:hypothetical protein
VKHDKVQEILIPATSLPNRILELKFVQRVLCFSQADKDLVEQLHQHFEVQLVAELSPKDKYINGQTCEPGSAHLEKTRKLIEAVLEGDARLQRRLGKELAADCFD